MSRKRDLQKSYNKKNKPEDAAIKKPHLNYNSETGQTEKNYR